MNHFWARSILETVLGAYWSKKGELSKRTLEGDQCAQIHSGIFERVAHHYRFSIGENILVRKPFFWQFNGNVTVKFLLLPNRIFGVVFQAHPVGSPLFSMIVIPHLYMAALAETWILESYLTKNHPAHIWNDLWVFRAPSPINRKR